MRVNVQFEGLDEAKKFFNDINTKIKANLRYRMNAEMQKLRNYIVSEKLGGQILGRGTGALIESIKVVPAKISGNVITGTIEQDTSIAPHGAYFEFGGKGPYQIIPVSRRALAFTIQATSQAGGIGDTIFAKKVNHPGIAKRPFLTPSLQERQGPIYAALQQAVTDTINRASKSS
jgi:hypothetical protein